ncbi:hypothetical protein ACLOJK_003385 [Asimina triloba]
MSSITIVVSVSSSIIVVVSSYISSLVSSSISIIVSCSSFVVVVSSSISDHQFLLSFPLSSSTCKPFLYSDWCRTSPLPASSPIAIVSLPTLSHMVVVFSPTIVQLSPIVSISSLIHSSFEASDCSHLFCLASHISLLHSPCKTTIILVGCNDGVDALNVELGEDDGAYALNKELGKSNFAPTLFSSGIDVDATEEQSKKKNEKQETDEVNSLLSQ